MAVKLVRASRATEWRTPMIDAGVAIHEKRGNRALVQEQTSLITGATEGAS